MAAPITLDATVSQDGKIELVVPELTLGLRVRITIEPPAVPQEQKPHAAGVLAGMQGHRLFKTAEKVDAYLNEERDSWGR